MKRCVNCKIYVGGEGNQCPICQNGLTGENSPYNWPSMHKLKVQSIFYKVQLFLVLTLVFVSLILDFMLGLNSGVNWSVPVAAWALSLELLIRHFIRKNVVVSAIITDGACQLLLVIIFTCWYMNWLEPILTIVVPIVLSVVIVADFVLALIDNRSNALVYLLLAILAGIIPYLVQLIRKSDISLTWTICMMLSVVAMIGICVFKGRSVRSELEKRMSL